MESKESLSPRLWQFHPKHASYDRSFLSVDSLYPRKSTGGLVLADEFPEAVRFSSRHFAVDDTKHHKTMSLRLSKIFSPRFGELILSDKVLQASRPLQSSLCEIHEVPRMLHLYISFLMWFIMSKSKFQQDPWNLLLKSQRMFRTGNNIEKTTPTNPSRSKDYFCMVQNSFIYSMVFTCDPRYDPRYDPRNDPRYFDVSSTQRPSPRPSP